MTPAGKTALSLLLWCLGLIPATLIALWMGLAEWSLVGALRAFVILAALVAAFELLRGVIVKAPRTPQNPRG